MKVTRSKTFRLAALVTLFAVSTLPCRSAPSVPFYHVKDFGATGDGNTKDTDAIRKAISTAGDAGGGTVYFPAGQYLTGSIHLRSNITLYLDAGAVLKFSQDFDDYLPMVKSRWEGTECTNFSPPIYAYRAENIAIVGRGLIDGQGRAWWDFHRKIRDEFSKKGKVESSSKWSTLFGEKNQDVPSRGRWEQMGNFLRPPMIQPFECRNVRIDAERGFSCSNAKHLTFRDVRINTKKGPALLCEKIAALEIDGCRTLAPHEDSAVIDLKDVAGAYLHGCQTTPGLFLRVQGQNSREIVLQANEFGKAASAVKMEEGVPTSALVQN